MARESKKVNVTKEERAEAKAYIDKIIGNDNKTIYLLAAIDSFIASSDNIINKFTSAGPAFLGGSILSNNASNLSACTSEFVYMYIGRKIKMATDQHLHHEFDQRSRSERESTNPEETNKYADTLSTSAACYAFQNAKMMKAFVRAGIGIGLSTIAIASSGITSPALVAGAVAVASTGSSVIPYLLNRRLAKHKVSFKGDIDESQKDVDSYSRQMYKNSKMIESVKAQKYAKEGLINRQRKTMKLIKDFSKKLFKYASIDTLNSILLGGATIAAATALGLSLPATALVTASVITTTSAVNQITSAYLGKREYLDTFAMTYRKFKTKFKDFVFGADMVKSNANVIKLENIAYKHRIKSGKDIGKREDKELFTSNETILIKPGITILSGASGAGKSTLTELLLHADNVTSGNIHIGTIDKDNNFEGQDYTSLAPCAPMDNIAISFQRPELIECSIDTYIRLGNPDADEEKVKQIKELLGIGNGENGTLDETKILRPGVSLSGGEQTRIGLAQALIKDSPVLILDEPTSGVDETMSANIVNHLRSLKDKTIIYITHNPSEIEKIGATQAIDIGRHSNDETTNTIKSYDLTDDATKRKYIHFFTDRKVCEEFQLSYISSIDTSKELDNTRARLKSLSRSRVSGVPQGISEEDLVAAKCIRGKPAKQAKEEARKVFTIIENSRSASK